MGICLSCCSNSTTESELLQPDIETKRIQQAEAAERRMREMEARGVKDPGRLKEKQKRLEELEKREAESARHGQTGEPLKWTVS